jgi:Short repeat of unknown function (DUF308)
MSVGSDSEIAQRLYNFRFLFLIEGTVLILLGCLAIGVPAISRSTATLAVGWIFLISGIVGFVPMFLAETYPGLWWSLISALLAVLVGIILITNNSQDLYGGLIGWPFRVEALSPLRKVLVMFSLIEGGAYGDGGSGPGSRGGDRSRFYRKTNLQQFDFDQERVFAPLRPDSLGIRKQGLTFSSSTCPCSFG